jgi:Cd2+/Zn2+-exporting ATPase
VADLLSTAGHGVEGVVDGRRVVVGTARLLRDRGVDPSPLLDRSDAIGEDGRTPVWIAIDGILAGIVSISDPVKPEARAAVAELHAAGIEVWLITGDQARTAASVAAQVGIVPDRIRAEMLPAAKEQAVADLQATGRVVAMVGDGINDAPALARADIGFAMGIMGSDAAIETADVALMDDDLRKVAAFIGLSKATHSILVQNITLALGIKAAFLVMALTGSSTLWMAVIADVGASLLVIGNGLRLLRK